jgi:two-component system, cell cycle response regulator DivK
MAQPTVLVIEDNVLNARLAEAVLTDAGYRVVVATTAEQALPMFHAHRPDVILMDIQLPRMDGVTALQYFRTDPQSRATKIIAVTGMAMKGDRERMLAPGGFDGYVAKPYLERDLLDAVRAAIGPGTKGPVA